MFSSAGRSGAIPRQPARTECLPLVIKSTGLAVLTAFSNFCDSATLPHVMAEGRQHQCPQGSRREAGPQWKVFEGDDDDDDDDVVNYTTVQAIAQSNFLLPSLASYIYRY